MTVHDWLNGAAILLMAAIVGWTVYQNIVLKKDVTILSTLKEVEELWAAVNKILMELGVETLEEAINEIGVLKGTIPTPAQQEEEWQEVTPKPAEPATKK